MYAGSTCTTGTPALRAMFAMNCPSRPKDQLEWVALPHCLKGVQLDELFRSFSAVAVHMENL